MSQWDIFLFPFTEEQPHPVVILSIDERAVARKNVNGLSLRHRLANQLDPLKLFQDWPGSRGRTRISQAELDG